MTYVLDACALIAYIKAEPGEDIVRDLLVRAKAREDTLYMNVFNLLEVCYGFYRDGGAEKSLSIVWKIRDLPITVIDRVSDEAFGETVRLKASYSCSLADAVGIATALELSAQFVTSDHKELEAVEAGERLSFLWLPPRPKK